MDLMMSKEMETYSVQSDQKDMSLKKGSSCINPVGEFPIFQAPVKLNVFAIIRVVQAPAALISENPYWGLSAR